MKSPLLKRHLRELKSDAGKYIVIFVFMIIVIGFVSGFMVASGSLMKIYDESFEKYNIEDGNFELYAKADDDTVKYFENSGDVKIYENFYIERETEDIDSTLRIYKIRNDTLRRMIFRTVLFLYSKNRKLDKNIDEMNRLIL